MQESTKDIFEKDKSGALKALNLRVSRDFI